eukprot:2658933-Rhodomonas_salina.1
MHDSVARVLVRHISDTLEGQGNLPPAMEVHIAKRADEIWPECPPDIADFVPDGIIITTTQDSAKHPSRVIVFEFARSYTIEEDELVSVGAAKRNQYQAFVQCLRPLYPRHANCESIGYTASQINKVQMAGIRECVMAGHRLNNTAPAQFEALRATGEPAFTGLPSSHALASVDS